LSEAIAAFLAMTQRITNRWVKTAATNECVGHQVTLSQLLRHTNK